MKNILIALLIIVIIGQSFSLHKCRCNIKMTWLMNDKVIAVQTFNGNTAEYSMNWKRTMEREYQSETIKYNKVIIKGTNP